MGNIQDSYIESLPIDLASMADSDDQDDEHVVVDGVENLELTIAHTEERR